ncbi:MAG: DMT family transporter [Opitutae bacterium]|nr:DMT family transporter [Opitutae bacterium]
MNAAVNPSRWWFYYAVLTMATWGVWGALIDSTARAGFPEALGYIVWTFTLFPPALFALWRAGWKVERDAVSVTLGLLAGVLGASGQLALFKVLRLAPAYLVFPIVSLSPVVTVALAFVLLRERVARKDWVGIALSLVAGVLLSYTPPAGGAKGTGWLLLALFVFLTWGVQGYVISHANRRMSAESIFFYMVVGSLPFLPVAWMMVGEHQPINWGWSGFWAAIAIQSLNSIGALLLVYAFRYGKAMVVAPLINAGAPVLTVFLSLLLYRTVPNGINLVGIAAALVATLIMALTPEPLPSTAETKQP